MYASGGWIKCVHDEKNDYDRECGFGVCRYWHCICIVKSGLSDMEAFGHSYSFDYRAFISVSVCALVVCVLLSMGILKEWKTKRIIEGIGKFE